MPPAPLSPVIVTVKKKLPPANTPLPDFASGEAAAKYFDTHSVAGVWDHLPAAEPCKLSKEATKSILERQARDAAGLDRARTPR